MASAETYRIATWNVELWRKGPGLLLRDLMRGEDKQIAAILTVIDEVRPDVLALQSFDYDLEGHALRAFADAAGYPFVFAQQPNTGRQVGLDVNGNGRLGEPEDALGFGDFIGQGGMAILSRYPFDREGVTNHSDKLWRQMPQTLLPEPGSWPSKDVHETLPLSSIGHWVVPVSFPQGNLTLMSFHAAPPVFDGPEDRNGRRNHDQIRFWQHLLDGAFGPVPKAPFVLLGQTNQDPVLGEGRKGAIRGLLADPRFQDPLPHDPVTVHWPNVEPQKMRVSYVLPDAQLKVKNAGVFWPGLDEPLGDTVIQASRHRMVWADIELP